MVINWGQEEQNFSNFLEEDLPFLIQSQYEDTIILLKKELQLLNSSLDFVLTQYPNFLEKIRYHLYFFFAHQMSAMKLDNGSDFYTQYFLLSTAYHNRYIYSFVENQLKEPKIQAIINY
jgi:hypothetical protein